MALAFAIPVTSSTEDASASPALAHVPFAKLPHGRALSAAKRAVATEAMRDVHSFHGCDKTIIACLQRRNAKTEIAWRLADYVAFLAGKGLDAKTITKILARRRESLLGKVHKIAVLAWPRVGSVKAPVTIVEFADFRCTHCAKVTPLLESLVKRYKGKLAVVFKAHPLKPYGAHLITAQAALAAQRQGKFWTMAESLYAHRDQHDKAGVRALAQKLGLNLGNFDASMTDRMILRQIERSKIEGLRLGIRGTPTLYVNGRQFLLRKDAMHLSQRVDDELFLLGK